MSKPFHIAVNARFLLAGKLEGLGRFSHEVLQRMVLAHPEIQFSFFFDRKPDPSFAYAKNVTSYALPPQARDPFLWHVWFQWSVRRKLAQLQPDVFFSPDGFLCLKTNVRQVAVIHDLAFEHHPEDTYPRHAKYYQKNFPRFARVADHLFTVSEFSRQDIAQRYKVNADKISVVGNAAGAHFHPVGEELQSQVRQKFSGGKPYFLYVGAIQPRKNLPNLLRAFAQFKAQTSSDMQLLIVGRKAWKFAEVEQVFESSLVKAQIHFTGFVSDEDLASIYGSALALCYLPFFEGFGIPVVEAMQSGCPVLTSSVSSLPEVAGGAALLADPHEVNAIALQLAQLANDENLRRSLVEKGLNRARDFSWDKTAEAILRNLQNLG
jgi:glycosyltransferase involved in cell wall biosynthesis